MGPERRQAGGTYGCGIDMLVRRIDERTPRKLNARDLSCESSELLVVSVLSCYGDLLVLIFLQVLLDGNQEE